MVFIGKFAKNRKKQQLCKTACFIYGFCKSLNIFIKAQRSTLCISYQQCWQAGHSGEWSERYAFCYQVIDLYKCFLVAVCSAPPKYFYLSTISLLLETLKQKGSCGSCQSSSQTGCLLVHTVCLGDFDGVLLCFRYTGIDALALLQN